MDIMNVSQNELNLRLYQITLDNFYKSLEQTFQFTITIYWNKLFLNSTIQYNIVCFGSKHANLQISIKIIHISINLKEQYACEKASQLGVVVKLDQKRE